MLCPKCQSECVKRGRWSNDYWCNSCNGSVKKMECVVCGKSYYQVNDHLIPDSKRVPTDPTVPFSNHKCDEKFLNNKEQGEKLAEKWEEGELTYNPSEEERMFKGLRDMEDEDSGYETDRHNIGKRKKDPRYGGGVRDAR